MPNNAKTRLYPKGAHVVFHRLIKTRPIRSHNDSGDKIGLIRAVLLCKRTSDAPIHPGLWSLIGGMIEKNEHPRVAAQREVSEELECSKFDKAGLKPLIKVKVSRRGGPCLISYFECQLEVDMDELRLIRQDKSAKVENEGIAWFTAEEVHHLPMRPEDRVAVIALFAKYGV